MRPPRRTPGTRRANKPSFAFACSRVVSRSAEEPGPPGPSPNRGAVAAPRLSSRSSARAGGNANNRRSPRSPLSQTTRRRDCRRSASFHFRPRTPASLRLVLVRSAASWGRRPGSPSAGRTGSGARPGLRRPEAGRLRARRGTRIRAAPPPPGTGGGNLLEPGAGGVGEVAAYAVPVQLRVPSESPPSRGSRPRAVAAAAGRERPALLLLQPGSGIPAVRTAAAGRAPGSTVPPERALARVGGARPLGPGDGLAASAVAAVARQSERRGQARDTAKHARLAHGRRNGLLRARGRLVALRCFAPPSRCVAASLAPSSSFPEPAPAVSPAGLADSAGFLAETPPSALAAARARQRCSPSSPCSARRAPRARPGRGRRTCPGSTNSSKSSWLRSR